MGRIIFTLLVQHLLIAATAASDGVTADAASACAVLLWLFFVYLLSLELNVSKALCWKILLLCFLFSSSFSYFFAEYILEYTVAKDDFFSVRIKTMRHVHTHAHIQRIDRVKHRVLYKYTMENIYIYT